MVNRGMPALTHSADAPASGPDRRSRSGDGLIRLIGNTPLLRIGSLEAHGKVQVYAKAEWTNPGGSVKDRAALAMMTAGEQSGELTPEKVLIDATSGNTGIAYAMLGAVMGYRVTLVMPANASRIRQQMVAAYGAEVILTDALGGMDTAIERVQQLVAADPERYFYPDQYSNPNNWQAHYRTTGEEIFRQTEGKVTHFVAGLGTTGTFVGTGRRLKAYNPDIQLIGMQPDSPLHGLEGLKHLETALVPGIYDDQLADRQLAVSTEAAHAMAVRLARAEGLLLSPSAAAAAVAAKRVAEEIDSGVIVTVFPDNASKYLDEPFWEL